MDRTACRACCAGNGPNDCAWRHGAVLPEEPADSSEGGSIEAGRRELLEGDYMTCGIPYKLWQVDSFRDFVAGGFGGDATAPRIEDRAAPNGELPYFLNAFTSPDGVQVVNGNCLMCHGGTHEAIAVHDLHAVG